MVFPPESNASYAQQKKEKADYHTRKTTLSKTKNLQYIQKPLLFSPPKYAFPQA